MIKTSLFMVLAFYIHNSSCIVDDLYDAGKMVWHLYLMLDKISLENNTNAAKVAEIFTHGSVKNEEIKTQMDEIFSKLDEIEKSINPEKISDSLKFSSSSFILRTRVSGLQEIIDDIHFIYKEFQKYMEGEYDNSENALRELVQRIIADILGDITWMRKLVIGKSEPLLNNINIIEAISVNAVRRRNELCNGPQLTASILAQLFKMVVIAEIKTNFMLSLANIHQYGRDHNGWKAMNSFSEAEFRRNFASYVAVFTLAMNATDELYFRACDPVNGTWVRDKNFYELEKTIQTTMFRYDSKQCQSASCNDVWFNKRKGCLPLKYDQRISCLHTTANCYDLGAIKSCALRSGPYGFQFVNSTKLGALGTYFTCPRDNGYLIEDGSGLDADYSACACDCYGNDNKISLSIMQSRIKSNWVITGLRFVRKNGILHIQPREGRLQANGYILPSNQRWIPIPNDPLVHTIDRENRVFFLDDLRLPSFHALTGVRFIKQIRGRITGFAIEIFGTPFSYSSGYCTSREYFGISVKNPDTITGSGIEFQKVPPTHANVRYTPNQAASNYVSLERSEFSADFGQSTLPFFDAVPIVPSPPTVLGGIGIFHKRADGYSGFISLRLFGIRYKAYLSDFRVLFNSSEHH